MNIKFANVIGKCESGMWLWIWLWMWLLIVIHTSECKSHGYLNMSVKSNGHSQLSKSWHCKYYDRHNTKIPIIQLSTACLSKYKYIIPIPLRVMVLFLSGSIPIPSWHKTRVPLKSEVAVSVAVDVMNVPVLTSVTANWNGGSEITWPRSLGRRDREMAMDGTLHRCAREGSVQVNVTPSPGHGLSTLDSSWAPETEITYCLQAHSQDFLKGGYINVWYSCVYV